MAHLRTTILNIVAIAVCVALTNAKPTHEEYKNDTKDAQARKDADAADNAKRSAVHKVIDLFENLRTQVLTEGNVEANSYNKFACFCSDTTAEKSDAIRVGNAEKDTLTARIGQLVSNRVGLDAELERLQGKLEQDEADLKRTNQVNLATLDTFKTNSDDLDAALHALEGAIQELKASKNPSLAQVNAVAENIRPVVLMAAALGFKPSRIQSKTFAFLQGAPDVPMENYDFHSDDIIGTLEKLQKDFIQEKNEVDKSEVARKSSHNSKVQFLDNEIKLATAAQGARIEERDQTISDIEGATQRQSTVAATLLDDKTYLNNLNDMCSKRATTWDQRSSVRQAEIRELTAAIEVMKDAVTEHTVASTVRFVQRGVSLRRAEAIARNAGAMEAIEAEVESDAVAPAGFLQRVSVNNHVSPVSSAAAEIAGKQAVATMLREQGARLHSTLLNTLASQVGSDDPFAKIKVLIQELITRLLAEESREGTQKSWCDKETSASKQKRDYAASAVDKLNSEMASLEALRDTLGEELREVNAALTDLRNKLNEASQNRETERQENAAAISEGEQGLAAVSQATTILKQYYGTIAKETVTYDTTLLQRGPADDAPDAGFENGEAYRGAQSEWGGILGMLDVISSDFQRTIDETKREDAESEQAFFKFKTATDASIAEKTQANSEKLRQQDDTKTALGEAEEKFESQVTELKTAIKELIELKAVCIDTGMSYASRVSARQDEIDALNKALCILEAYAEYGPNGLAGSALGSC